MNQDNNNKRSFLIVDSDSEEEEAMLELEISALKKSLRKKYKRIEDIKCKRLRRQIEEEVRLKIRRESREFPNLPKYTRASSELSTYTNFRRSIEERMKRDDEYRKRIRKSLKLNGLPTNTATADEDEDNEDDDENILKFTGKELLEKCIQNGCIKDRYLEDVE